MLTVTALKAVLEAQHLRLTKRLGQHHLIDARLIQRILDGCGLAPEETVVEIGAGLGALTESLAQRAGRVIAVEVDRRISTALEARMREHRNVTVACQDILRFAWDDLREVVVVGAIPYHITSPIFVSLCEHRAHIRRAVLIIQQEVAQRLLAVPGTKAYGRLSVLGQYCWEIASLTAVPRSAFFPQPTVDSMALRLVARSHAPVAVESEAAFFGLVKAAFSHRRKTLVNCLMRDGTRAISRPEAQAVLKSVGLHASVRGEALSLEQFAALANRLKNEYT